jgi:hypothetical protein
MPNQPQPYRTTELEIASFLKAKGLRLLRAEVRSGNLVDFYFEPSAESSVEEYLSGYALPARELFEAHRGLRALIQQVREHTSQRIRSENKWGHIA